MKKISVIIPCYNAKDTLDVCLKSIMNCDDPNYEVIVVDDSSTDNSPDIALSYPNVRLIQPGERLGAGGARERGIRDAQGEIIVYTDSDCVVPVDWLKKVRMYLTPDLGGIGGFYDVWPEQSFMGRFVTYDYRNFWFRFIPEYPDHVATGNCAFWKSVLLNINQKQITETFKGMAAAEDTLLGLEVSKTHKLRYYPDWYIRHISPESLKNYWGKQKTRGYSRIIISQLHFHTKVLKTRDISMGHVLWQLLSCAGVWLSPILMIINLYLGLMSLLLMGLWFILLQWNPLIYMYQREKSIVFVAKSLPLMFIRNTGWWVGAVKAGWQIILSVLK